MRHLARPFTPLLLALATPLFAGDDKTADAKKITAAEETEEASPWSGSLSTGWDSLYMFRGVNEIPGFGGYGSSLQWTALSVSWAPTDNDTFTAGTWMAFGLGDTTYKELDTTLEYARTIGHLELSAQYALYSVLSEPGGIYSNELSAAASYELALGPVTLTPNISYVFALGPSPDNHGYITPSAGYLQIRLDAEIPLYRKLLTAAPYILSGFNFSYSLNANDEPFNGADHLETGLAFPIALNDTITISPYAAYSYSYTSLAGTKRNTFWGGLSVNFGF